MIRRVINLEGKINWVLEVDTAEFRLILKALGGRLKDHIEESNAITLGDKLTKLRAERLKGIATTADQLDTALQEKDKK